MPFTSLCKSALLVFVAGFGLLSDYSEAVDSPPAAEDISRIYPGEVIAGSDNAPVTVIVYMSYECPYCSAFEKEILPALKTRFVDSGKVKLVHRVFPMTNDLTSDNFMKTELALCSAQAGGFAGMTETLFNHQQADFWKHYEAWIDYSSTAAAAAGIKACVDFHKARHTAIVTQQRYAYHQIRATPTIFINGRKMEGLHPYEDYEKVIMRLLKS